MTEAVAGYRVLSRTERFAGPVFSVVTDEVAMSDGRVADRDYIVHIGAVGVVAVDEADRVVLVRQYRHPLRRVLWELPAGLVDVHGEPMVAAAARELAEEADLVAGRYDLLADVNTSPGCSNELVRLFLARDLSAVPDGGRYERTHEEAELTAHRIPLDEAVDMVLSAQITNAVCQVGVLSTARVRDNGWAGLRPLDSPLP
ncbi:MAG TPA: NUDIX hydrolase [Micromonosporaceae bacterium]|nr:NUDIX hydrolase [Micromonosporaceae bacterium]